MNTFHKNSWNIQSSMQQHLFHISWALLMKVEFRVFESAFWNVDAYAAETFIFVWCMHDTAVSLDSQPIS